MGRTPQASAAAKTAPVVSTEGMTPEEAANLNLKDNLPVRATMGDIPDYPGEGGHEHAPRRERGNRERRERRGRSDRGPRHKHGSDRPAYAESEVEAAAEAPPSTEGSAPAEVEGESAQPIEERPRRVRFEDASPEASQRSVQEFRPSSHRRARTDEEASENLAERSAEKARTPGLLGWMKSIFSGNEEAATPAPESETADEAPRRPRSSRGPRDRGPRRTASGGGQPSSDDDGGGKRRRRRRRRGGRSRHASSEQGSSGGAPG